MKTLLHLLVIFSLLVNDNYAQSLSIRAKKNFCSEAYFQYSTIRNDQYIATMYRYFAPKGLTTMEIDEIFETSLKSIESFRRLILATYDIGGGTTQYLYMHLHDFLRLTVSDSKELIPYILAEGRKEIEERDKSTKEIKGVPMVVKCDKKLTLLEKELSIVYTKLYNSLNPENRVVLKNSQLEWIKAKEKKCLSEQQDFDGGTKAGLVFCDCSVLETQKRVEALKNGTYR